MALSAHQIAECLQLPYVGQTVLQRLQEVGLDDVALLNEQSAETVLLLISEHLHSSCWRNSPQAKQAIANILAWAKQYQ